MIARPPSATITTAIPRSAIESIAGSTFGRISRRMTRACFAPCARAASTNSRSDHERVDARVMRASTGIETIASPMVTFETDRPRKVTIDEREHERREGEEDVERAADEAADAALEVAGDEPEEAADQEPGTRPTPTPMNSELRAPQITRDMTSRPLPSRPIG